MYNELTQKDIDDMKAEVERRKCVVRKELLEDVKTARAHGDLSENFEYGSEKWHIHVHADCDRCDCAALIQVPGYAES